jgi:hypothetical protein
MYAHRTVPDVDAKRPAPHVRTSFRREAALHLMSDATRGCGRGSAQVMQDMVMDVVRALTSPNLDIRRKTLDIALELITPRNIDEVVLTLKKEVVKTQNRELEKNGEYRQMLVQVRVSPTPYSCVPLLSAACPFRSRSFLLS